MNFFQKEHSIFDLLTETISEGIVIVDTSQIIVAVNDTLAQLFGYERDELLGKPLQVLIPMEHKSKHTAYVHQFMGHSQKRIMGQGRELFGLRKDGSSFPLEVGLKPFEANGKHCVMAMVIDISLQKQREQQMMDINAELERRVDERTQALQASILHLKDEIEKRKEAENQIKESLRKERELNDLKTKFLSLVSHEFKTPLSGILTSSSLISKYTQTDQQEKRDKHIKTIVSKVKYLNNILDDFLSVERLETGKVNYKLTAFPLSRVINEVVYNSNMLLKEGQHIEYPEGIDDMEIYFDEKALELVLTNLINNAIKYSPENTTIRIQVQPQEKQLLLKVMDEGIGIPEKEQKFIFNRYFRAENALLNEGTGIGLNIAQSHLENLQGGITFESKENMGTTFTVSIPYKSQR